MFVPREKRYKYPCVSDKTEDSEIGNIPTTSDNKIGNYINGPTTTEMENFKTNHFDDSSGDYANFPERTDGVSPKIRDKELNYHDVNIRIKTLIVFSIGERID